MDYLSKLLGKKWFRAIFQCGLIIFACLNVLSLISSSGNVSKFKYIQLFAFFPVIQSLNSVVIAFSGAMVARYSRSYFFVATIIVTAILNLATGYGYLYQITGLYSTHCPPGDLACQTIQTHNGFDMLYFSITTLTTLGVGDYIPTNNLCKIFVETETILGYLVLALSVAALTNLMQHKD